MEVNLEGLIAKIHEEGVLEARKNAEEILVKARADAAAILEQAKQEAVKAREEAKRDAAGFQANAQTALKQAARDVMLSVKQELRKVFDSALSRRIAETLDVKFTAELILKVLAKWSPQAGALEVLVSEKDKAGLESLVRSQFRPAAGQSIEIKVAGGMDKGFRVAVKGEDAVYDFSDESISNALKEFLSPAIAAVLKTVDE